MTLTSNVDLDIIKLSLRGTYSGHKSMLIDDM